MNNNFESITTAMRKIKLFFFFLLLLFPSFELRNKPKKNFFDWIGLDRRCDYISSSLDE